MPERWEKCIINDGAYFECRTFYHSSEFNVFFRKKFAFHTCTPDKYKVQISREKCPGVILTKKSILFLTESYSLQTAAKVSKLH